MFDPKMQDDTDDGILKEIISMCEKHMGGGLKKPEEPMVGPEVPEDPMAEAKPDLENADLDELMEMYKNIKG